jgi:hypothetical protein
MQKRSKTTRDGTLSGGLDIAVSEAVHTLLNSDFTRACEGRCFSSLRGTQPTQESSPLTELISKDHLKDPFGGVYFALPTRLAIEKVLGEDAFSAEASVWERVPRELKETPALLWKIINCPQERYALNHIVNKAGENASGITINELIALVEEQSTTLLRQQANRILENLVSEGAAEKLKNKGAKDIIYRCTPLGLACSNYLSKNVLSLTFQETFPLPEALPPLQELKKPLTDRELDFFNSRAIHIEYDKTDTKTRILFIMLYRAYRDAYAQGTRTAEGASTIVAAFRDEFKRRTIPS